MRIEITVPVGNPWRTACAMIIVGLILVPVFVRGQGRVEAQQAQGGAVKDGAAIVMAEQDVTRARIKQEVLKRREEILRYQLLKLEDEAKRMRTNESTAELSKHRDKLVEMIKEKQLAENLLKESLIELWDAQGIAFSTQVPENVTLTFDWPVEPIYGVSARFEDDAYEHRFGIPHHAVDIPIEQGSVVRAPADGIVKVMKDNGLGYSYLVISHKQGVETVYGHVAGFLVQEGDRVFPGDPIALSGGRPGSQGAGLLTTGPHLHFAVRVDGVLVDPMEFLKPWKDLKDFEG